LTLERGGARLEDPGAKLLDAIARFFDRFGRMMLIGLAVVVVVVAGIILTLRTRAAAEEQAAGRLAEANVHFWQGDYNRSLQVAREVAEQWPGAPSGIEAHRLAGDNQFWLGDFQEAASEYRRYLEKRKSGVIADAVRRSLAYVLESDHQYQEAATLYEGLVGRFGRESSAEFLFAAARCYRLAGQPQEADQRLGRLLDDFGETTYAGRARILRAELAAASQ
jgi:tetratricopeptide (TPR) repeat protein